MQQSKLMEHYGHGEIIYGQLGQMIDSGTNYSSPVQIGTGTTWVKIAGNMF